MNTNEEILATICAWMVDGLGLSGNSLVIYAFIHERKEPTSVSDITSAIRITRNGAMKCLNAMTEAGILIRHEERKRGGLYLTFTASR